MLRANGRRQESYKSEDEEDNAPEAGDYAPEAGDYAPEVITVQSDEEKEPETMDTEEKEPATMDTDANADA